MPLAKRGRLPTCTSPAQLANGKEKAAGESLRWQRGSRPMCKGGWTVRIYAAMTRLSSMRTA